MGKIGPNGEYLTIDRAVQEIKRDRVEKQESHPPKPAATPQPPVPVDPGPDPGAVTIDEFYVEKLAQESLPDSNAFAEYAYLAKEKVFATLAEKIIQASGENSQQFADDVLAAAKEMTEAEKKLNTKQLPPDQSVPPIDWPPMPGINPDDACASLFDVNDLALRGRKSVTARRYYQPLILTDAFISDPRQSKPNTWLFGQRLEYQQEWRHAGFTLGELISSMSLLPGEELTIEVNSWQRTRTEIAQEQDETTKRIFANEQRTSDERTCTNATAWENGWSVTASGSVSYPVASASITATASGSSSERAEQSSRAIREATTKSTNEVSSRRAIKLTQTSEAGSESTTTRRIRNPNACHTVTYNFFQVVKLYDMQMRLIDDSPLLLLPGIFPRFYGTQQERRGEAKNAPTEVEIPFHVLEGWRSPAVFLLKYFDVDRDLSREMSGWALRFRLDTTASPAEAVQRLAEGLVVATQFLFKLEPDKHVSELGELLKNYLAGMVKLRQKAAASYGPDLGQSMQLNTTGVYVDALRGRCTACEDHTEAGRYVEVMRQYEELRSIERANQLVNAEIERRKKLLETGKLEPFEAKLVEGSQ